MPRLKRELRKTVRTHVLLTEEEIETLRSLTISNETTAGLRKLIGFWKILQDKGLIHDSMGASEIKFLDREDKVVGVMIL